MVCFEADIRDFNGFQLYDPNVIFRRRYCGFEFYRTNFGTDIRDFTCTTQISGPILRISVTVPHKFRGRYSGFQLDQKNIGAGIRDFSYISQISEPILLVGILVGPDRFRGRH